MSAGDSGEIEERIGDGGAGENAEEADSLDERVDAQLGAIEHRQRRRTLFFLLFNIQWSSLIIDSKGTDVFVNLKRSLL